MSYRRDLKLLRRAQKLAKRQQRQLAKLELTGLTAVTLHAHAQHLTIALISATGAPFTDTLRELLRERRQSLQAQTHDVLQAWLEEERLRDQSASAAGSALP